MLQIPQSEPVPITMTPERVARVGSTRVTLDSVLHAYNNGASPEEIVYRFSALKLADVHGVIAFYLRHPQAVNAYLEASEAARAHSS